MITNLTPIRRRTLVAASMCLFLWIYIANAGRHQTPPNAVAIRFTVQKLSERINAAHGALTHNKDAVCQKVDLQYIVVRNGEMHPAWVVGWEDSRGESLSRTTWDAATGALLEAVHPPQRPRIMDARPQTNSSATRAAWLWMHALGVDRNAKIWRLMGTPHIKNLDWLVTFQAGDCQATVLMDRQTLDINYFCVRYS